MAIKYMCNSNVGSRNYYAPANSTILWAGASAPTGWTFVTSLDGYFVQGYDNLDLTARGAETHVHTNPTLNTTGAHNNHTVTVPNPSGWVDNFIANTGSAQYSGGSHTHPGVTSSNESSAGNHSHTQGNTGAASNLPKYRKLRWITCAAKAEIPIGGIVMHSVNTTALGVNWKVCNGASGTPDMQGYFIYSSATGVGETGGSDTHAHTNPNTSSSGSHVHTVDLVTGNNEVATNGGGTDSQGHGTVKSHKHYATPTSSAGGEHAHPSGDTSTDTVLPPYIQLYFMQRVS